MEQRLAFRYEADTTRSLSTEVVTAVAKAHDEDVLDQQWRIDNDINTDALDGLFQDNNLDTTLQFEADTSTVTILKQRENPAVHGGRGCHHCGYGRGSDHQN